MAKHKNPEMDIPNLSAPEVVVEKEPTTEEQIIQLLEETWDKEKKCFHIKKSPGGHSQDYFWGWKHCLDKVYNGEKYKPIRLVVIKLAQDAGADISEYEYELYQHDFPVRRSKVMKKNREYVEETLRDQRELEPNDQAK